MRFADYRSRAPRRSVFAVVFWWIGVRSIVRVGLRLLYRQRCLGREHLPVEGPVLYVSNHQSHFDPPIVGCLVGPFSSLARATLFKPAPFAWLIRQLGAIPLHQDRNPASAMRAAVEELKSGGRVLVFPEGSRTLDGQVARFRPGMMVLLRRAGATVVPIAIEGAHEVWPRGRRLPRLRGRIMVAAGPPIAGSDLLSLETDEALNLLRGTIDAMRLDLRRKGSGSLFRD